MADEKKKKYPPGKNPNSLKNLAKGRRFSKVDEELTRKAQAKGIATKNINKLVRDTISDYLLRPDKRTDFVERMEKYGWKKEEATHLNEVLNGGVLKAKAGDVAAIRLVLKLIGVDVDENPSVNVNVNSGSVITLGDKVFEE